MSATLTLESLTEMATSMARASSPFVCVGVVCNPSGMSALHDLHRGPPNSPLYPALYGLPIYRRVEQEELFRAFYDEGELQRYLEA